MFKFIVSRRKGDLWPGDCFFFSPVVVAHCLKWKKKKKKGEGKEQHRVDCTQKNLTTTLKPYYNGKFVKIKIHACGLALKGLSLVASSPSSQSQ